MNANKNKNKGFANAKLKKKLAHPLTFFQLNCNGLFEHPRYCRQSRYDFSSATNRTRRTPCECCPSNAYFEANLKRAFEYIRENEFHLCYFSETWMYGDDAKGTQPMTNHPLCGEGAQNQNGGGEEETCWLRKYGLSDTYRVYFSLQNCNYFGSRDTAWAGNVVFLHRDVQPPVKIRRHADIGLTQNNASYQGRYLEFEFPDGFHVLNTYMPFSGFNDNKSRTKKKIALRKTVDLAVRERLVQLREEKKFFVWMGDLNVSPGPLDHFLGEPARAKEYAMSMAERRDGSHIEDVDDRGEYGYTNNEKKRFNETVRMADAVDAYRYLFPNKRIYTHSQQRWDHYIVSKKIIEENRLAKCEIHVDKTFSSDHCVVTMKLSEKASYSRKVVDDDVVVIVDDDDDNDDKNMSMIEQLRAKRLKRFDGSG